MRTHTLLKSTRGFSLTELMVVIAIIGLLAGVVALSLIPTVDRAKQAKAKHDIATLRAAVMSYRMERGVLPDVLADLRRATKDRPDGYIEALPNDPWERPYIYERESRRFSIKSYGADGQEGGDAENADIPPVVEHIR